MKTNSTLNLYKTKCLKNYLPHLLRCDALAGLHLSVHHLRELLSCLAHLAYRHLLSRHESDGGVAQPHGSRSDKGAIIFQQMHLVECLHELKNIRINGCEAWCWPLVCCRPPAPLARPRPSRLARLAPPHCAANKQAEQAVQHHRGLAGGHGPGSSEEIGGFGHEGVL